MPLHPAPTIQNELCLVTQKITHTANGHTAECTYAVVNHTALSTQAVADAVQLAWNDWWPAELDNETVSLQPGVVEGDGSNVPAVATGSLAVEPGIVARTGPSAQVCALMRKNTPLGGRRNRGRMYIPYILSNASISEGGAIDPAAVALLQASAEGFLAQLVTSNVPMCISNKTLAVDPVTGKKYVTHIGAGPEVSTVVMESTVATQRRRVIRV